MNYSSIWEVLAFIVGFLALISIWYFYLRPRGRQKTPQGDASVIVGKDGEAGKIVAEAETDGNTPGAATVNVGTGAKVGDITTKVTKTKP